MFSINNHLNLVKKIPVLIFCVQWFFGSGSLSFDKDPYPAKLFIQIRIQGNDTDSADPDPHCREVHGSCGSIKDNL